MSFGNDLENVKKGAFHSLQAIKCAAMVQVLYMNLNYYRYVTNTVQIEAAVGACCDFQGLIQVSWEGTQ